MAHAAMLPQNLKAPDGVTARLFSDSSVPIVAMTMMVPAGSAQDLAGKEGSAALLASMLSEGPEGRTAADFKKRLEDLGIRLSFSVSRDGLRISLRTLTRHLPEALTLVSAALQTPRWDREDYARVVRQHRSGLQYKQQTPAEQASDLWWRTAFAGHPYAHPEEGTAESLDAIQLSDLKDLYARCVRRGRVLIGIAGDIERAAAEQAISDVWEDISIADCPPLAAANVAITERAVHTMAVPQSVAIFGHRGLDRADPDFYAAMILNYTLGGGGFSSRLMEEVREKRGLTYGISTGLSQMEAAPLLLGRVASSNQDIEKALSLTKELWAEMADQGITAAELSDAKTYLNGAFPIQQDSSSKLASLMLSTLLYELPVTYLEDRAKLIDAVTLEDANRVAKKLLSADDLVIAIAGDPQ